MILITGGAGFIGPKLAKRLLGCGETIRILDNLSSGSLSNLSCISGSVKLVKGDAELTRPDVGKAHRELGWKANTGIKEGLKMTLGWFEERLGKVEGAKRLS